MRRAAAPPGSEPVDSISRRYYDAEADRLDQEEYYRHVKPDSPPGALYTRLSNLVRRTHRRKLGYNPGRYLYPWVDLRPSLRLKSIYSPGEVRAEDPVHGSGAPARYAEALHGTDAVSIARRIADIETESFFNCEHAVPRIWFDDKTPMRGDLHHLFTCSVEANSLRSSARYHDFPDADPTAEGLVDAEERYFEPAAGRGAVARATLYFLLRYPIQAGPLSERDLGLLLEWNRLDPPGLYEQHRNREIFKLQGNRNPFIDHPEWADRVSFSIAIL